MQTHQQQQHKNSHATLYFFLIPLKYDLSTCSLGVCVASGPVLTEKQIKQTHNVSDTLDNVECDEREPIPAQSYAIASRRFRSTFHLRRSVCVRRSRFGDVDLSFRPTQLNICAMGIWRAGRAVGPAYVCDCVIIIIIIGDSCAHARARARKHNETPSTPTRARAPDVT